MTTEAQINAAALAIINKARADDEDVVLAPLSSLSEVYWSYADWARETARAALEAAERAAWRPIDSVPPNTPVLVFSPELDQGKAPYVCASSHVAAAIFGPVKLIDGLFVWDRSKPVAWRPLPAPPEGTPVR